MAEIAKFAVKEITEDFDESNEWALQHVAKVQQTVRYLKEMCWSELRRSIQVVKDKYIVYNLSLHMTESNCARGVRSVYTEDCKLTARAPTNYCEVNPVLPCYHGQTKLYNKIFRSPYCLH